MRDFLRTAALVALAWVPLSVVAEPEVGKRVDVTATWPIDVYVESHLVDGQPEWPTLLVKKFAQGHTAIQVRDHELDVACPVEVAVANTTVYRIGEGGWVEGGGSPTSLRMPHDAPGLRPTKPFETTRLYVAPGPGYAFGRQRENAAYTWVGKWAKGSPRGLHGDFSGLIEPWGRCCGWVFIHELGHVTGGHHMAVRDPAKCSFMSYGDVMFPYKPQKELCPLNSIRMFRRQCDQWLARARKGGTPPPDPADANRDGRVDPADLAIVRAIVDGTHERSGPPPCLGFASTGPCELYPAGDANRDLRVDAADLDVLSAQLSKE